MLNLYKVIKKIVATFATTILIKNLPNRQINKINRIYSAIQRTEKPPVRLPLEAGLTPPLLKYRM